MDALFHFALSFAGGYILLRGLKTDFRIWHLLAISLLAGLIDIDHIITTSPAVLYAHNLIFIIGLPLGFFFVFSYMKNERLKVYSLLFIVMWAGHLLMDMIAGMYGIPLFFPLSGQLYMIPQGWSFIEIDNSYVIAPAGIAVAAYFSLIFAIMLLLEGSGNGASKSRNSGNKATNDKK